MQPDFNLRRKDEQLATEPEDLPYPKSKLIPCKIEFLINNRVLLDPYHQETTTKKVPILGLFAKNINWAISKHVSDSSVCHFPFFVIF